MVSPAPQESLRGYAERMGWTRIPWFTIRTERFSADFGVDQWFGLNVLLRDGDDVYRTYFLQNGRMVQQIGSIWTLLNLTPYGGQSEDEDSPEGWPRAPDSFWFRRHDEFDEPPPSANAGESAQRATSAGEEARDLLDAASRRLVEDEVPDALERDESRPGDLVAEALGSGERRELVVGAPEDQRRSADLGELALPGLELLEVHRAVEVERRALAAALLERGPVGVDVVLVEGVAERAEQAAKPSRSIASTIASPSSPRIASAMPCHLPSLKKPVLLITSAATRSGWSHAQASPTNPPQSWTTSADALIVDGRP